MLQSQTRGDSIFFVGKGGRQSGDKPNPYFHMFLSTMEESKGTDLKVLAGSCDRGHDQEKVTWLLYVLILEYFLRLIFRSKKGVLQGGL